MDKRIVYLKRNMIFSLFGQIVTIVCGFFLPKLYLDNFGSEAYGATASIAQFLSYITLLECGIGGVARSALYKPIAENDIFKISAIMAEIKRFFRVIAYIYLCYVAILACFFDKISHIECFDKVSTFCLVVVISLSAFAEYLIGISYSLLLQASQREYISKIVSAVLTVLNAVCVFLFVKLGFGLIVVKLVSSFVFVLKPILFYFIVKKKFKLVKVKTKGENYLKQKWDGLGQHLAFVLHSNTDVMVITLFNDLSKVSVYSVYNMIIVHIHNVALTLTAGMEALLGNMLANNEKERLHNVFNAYEVMISVVSIVLFSSLTVMIVPFVRLYTAAVSDANYIEPVFAAILILSSVLTCWRLPYTAVVAAAGHFKQTRAYAFAEAIVNLTISVLLVNFMGLKGVAIGTVLGTMTRYLFHVRYLSVNIINRRGLLFVKRFSLNLAAYCLVIIPGYFFIGSRNIQNYFIWFIYGLLFAVISAAVAVCVNILFYKKDTKKAFNMFFKI